MPLIRTIKEDDGLLDNQFDSVAGSIKDGGLVVTTKIGNKVVSFFSRKVGGQWVPRGRVSTFIPRANN
ncbi:MAG TPA: hypothetical protein VMW42_03545 [Desulfatiglandales bacterium]|nr:hypothetical protein [Desulfatiglandales bacterium]